MALVKFGAGIVQMSGSIAGSTFARNRFGNYVRARTKPINPNTDLQVSARSALAEVSTRWSQTLTGAQRTAWNLYGSSVAMKNRLGETVFLTGFNHYVRSNTIRKVFGRGFVDDGPVIFELPAHDPLFAVTASEAAQRLEITFSVDMDWSTEADAFLFVSQGQPQNPQRNFFNGPWRHVTGIAGEDPGPPISPDSPSVVFPIAEGQRIWCFARIARADGRLSTPFRSDFFVSA